MKFLSFFTLTTLMSTSIFTTQSQITPISFRNAQSFSVLAHETVTNTGNTVVSCNVGVSPGSSITGFGYSQGILIDGRTEYGDFYRQAGSLAGAAQISAQALYDSLSNLVNPTPTNFTGINLGDAYQVIEIQPGIYTYSAGALIGGTLILNDTKDPNSIFIFDIASTLTTATYTTIKMKSGGTGRNVFWLIGSSATIETYTNMVGNVIAVTSISIKTGAKISGKLIALNAAITMDDNIVSDNSCMPTILPITYQSFIATCNNQNSLLEWSTASEFRNSYFTIESSPDGITWKNIGLVKGALNSSKTINYTFVDKMPISNLTYYRLKQTGIDGVISYSTTIILKNCATSANSGINLYPSTSSGNFNLTYSGDKSKVKLIEIFSANGQKVFETLNFQSSFNLSDKAAGLYYLRLHSNTFGVEHATFNKSN